MDQLTFDKSDKYIAPNITDQTYLFLKSKSGPSTTATVEPHVIISEKSKDDSENRVEDEREERNEEEDEEEDDEEKDDDDNHECNNYDCVMKRIEKLKENEKSKKIVDVFERASSALEHLRISSEKDNKTTEKYSDILRKFYLELDKIMEAENYRISFSTARLLDCVFMGCYDNDFWWTAFDMPIIDSIIPNEKFPYAVPKCGFRVVCHGLLTMGIEINDPHVIGFVKEKLNLVRTHIDLHKDAEKTNSAIDENVCNETKKHFDEIDNELYKARYDAFEINSHESEFTQEDTDNPETHEEQVDSMSVTERPQYDDEHDEYTYDEYDDLDYQDARAQFYD
jgi:hypothetical protein